MTTLSKPGILVLLCGVLLLTFNTSLAAECVADPWVETLSYSRGDIVSHVSHEWRAKRNTAIGVAPGTHKPSWADLGACESGSGEPPIDPPTEPTPIQIFGVWHCGNTFCDWRAVRDTRLGSAFDHANRWIIDRGDGSDLPSVNLVILSFLEPMKLLNETSDDAF